MNSRPAAPSISSVADPAHSVDQLPSLTNPHYAQLGGHTAVVRLVDAFYAQMDHLPEARHIRAMHPPDLSAVKSVLVRFLCEWLGGPADYSAQRGHPRLRRRHLPFPIGAAERDAWLACMRGALDQLDVDPRLKEQLMQAFFRTADFLRNDPQHHHGVQR